jgi:predicted permease
MPEWRSDIRGRLGDLRVDPAREADIVEELSQHLDDRFADVTADGASPADARRIVLEELDEQGVLHARLRDLRQARVPSPLVPGIGRRRLVTDIVLDVRHAGRLVRKQPAFSLAIVLTLGLGLGANAAMFSLVSATLWQRLPAHAPEELVYAYNGRVGNAFSYPGFAAMRDAQTIATGFAAWGGLSASLSADGETDLVSGVIVTGNFFDVLGVTAAQGRLLSPADDVTPGGHPVAVISDGLWRRRFGARPDIVGHTVRLNAQPFTIVGVTAPEVVGPQVGVMRDLYVPMMMQAVMRPPRAGYSGEMDPDLLRNATNGWLMVLARLRPDVTPEQAGAALGLLATNFTRTVVPDAPARAVPIVRVDDADATERARMRSVAWLLAGVVGTVLLIACVNVANLLLSRASARRRELAVRVALGASRGRLVRQLLAEATLLALLGGAAGLVLAWGLISGFNAVPPPAGALPMAIELAIDRRVLVWTALLALASGALFGLLPAWTASRSVVTPALKDDGSGAERQGRLGLKRSLAIVEIAASLVLLLAGGLFVRSLQAAYAIDPGVDAPRLVSAPININLLRYTRTQGRQFYEQAIERIRALPGVEAAALARVPLFANTGRTMSLFVEGRSAPDNRFSTEGGPQAALTRDTIRANVVSPGFFDTLGIPLVRGRDLTLSDGEDTPPVVVISAAAARQHFPDTEAVGKRISFAGHGGPWVQVVGVVEDANYERFGEDPTPVVYLPLAQNHETGMVLYARTPLAPATLVGDIRRTLQSLEPHLPVPDVETVGQTIATSLYAPRMGAWLLTVFGVLALALATIGVYGVLAFTASRRTREFGIRVALGATRGDVFRLVLREGAWLVGAGVAAGLLVGAWTTQAVSRFLYGIDAHDTLAFGVATVTLLVTAGLACVVPARRATRADPLSSLRAE